MKKMLIVTDIPQFVNRFLLPNIIQMQENGYTVDVATSKGEEIPYIDNRFNIEIGKSPYRLKNIKAYKQLKNIIKENNYDIVDTHTPMGGVLGRLAANKYRIRGTKVFYTGHGFHFHKGAPLKNWLFYYPMEKYLSKKTDNLIVLNKEDYELSTNKFYSKKIYKINSVGVNLDKFIKINEENKIKIREKNSLSQTDFLVSIIGELNKNKNQLALINAINNNIKKMPRLKLLLIGEGVYKELFEAKIIKLNLQDNIKILGRRDDINELINISDLIISSSFREGLPVNIIEAMAVGKQILVSPCRGNIDLIKNNYNGIITKGFTSEDFSEELIKFYNNKYDTILFSLNNLTEVKKYDVKNVLEEYSKIYLTND